MRILTLDAAGAHCAVAIVDADDVTEQLTARSRGQSSVLAPMVEAALAAGLPDLVAVTVGPGSFTGLRAALSLASGLGLGAGLPVIAVGVGEALREAMVGRYPGRRLWIALATRPGGDTARVFLDSDDAGGFTGQRFEALPPAMTSVAVAGDAATAVAIRLAARGDDVALVEARRAAAASIARVARERHAGLRAGLPLRPLYVDPPAVTR